MNSHVTSNKSIEKQLLVNNLDLFPELKNVVKEFTFYDKVSQVSRNIKNSVMIGLNLSLVAPGAGYHYSVEGYGTMVSTGEMVRYKQIGIRYLESNHGLHFVICCNCGNYILSESSNTPHIQCTCGVIDMIDDEEEDDIIDEGFEEEPLDLDDDDDAVSATDEEIMDAYNDWVVFHHNAEVEAQAQAQAETHAEAQAQPQEEESQEEEEEEDPNYYFREVDAAALEYEMHQDYIASRTVAIVEDDDDEEFRVSNYFNQFDYDAEDEY